MTEQIKAVIRDKKAIIDELLPSYVTSLNAPKTLKEAMVYSLNAGGKRLRPALLLLTMEAFQKDETIAYPVASAIEMVHTYSLIHDDLPAMDDDDLRRGLPTNHKMFGEAIAILAGDALLTKSFELIASMNNPQVTAEMKAQLISLFSKAAGAEGMVGGQVADLEGENRALTLEELVYIHEHKTGDLLTFPVVAACVLSEATEAQTGQLKAFAYHLGLAFQIKDDILDVEGDEAVIGKPVGSDVANHKSTYPKLLTLEGAKEKLAYHTQEAKAALRSANVRSHDLEVLTDYIATRDH